MATDYTSAIQKLYVAYFNRPGDATGVAFWNAQLNANSGNVAAISTAFSGSAEYLTLYAGQNNDQLVNNLYMNLFGRAAEPAGLTFWSLRLAQGLETISSIAAQLANNAQGTDATAVANKVAAATLFTQHLDTTPEIVGYSGYAANSVARAWLANVTNVAATLTAATASVDTTVTNATQAGTGTAGTTFALTTGLDHLVGTTFNDTFNAVEGQITGLDSIDGGTGTDTLNISDVTGATADLSLLTVTNVEKLVLASSKGLAGSSADVSGWTGLTSATFSLKATHSNAITVADTTALTVANGTGQDIFTSGGSTVTVSNGAGNITVAGGALTSVTTKGGVTVDVTDSSTAGTLAWLTVDGDTAGVVTHTVAALTHVSVANTTAAVSIANATASHTQNLTLNKVTGGATITDAAATTVNVTSTGTASAVHLAAAAATAVNITAGVGLDITGSTLASATTITGTGAGGLTANFTAGAAALTAVDLSGSTGANAVTVVATQETYTGGSGADTVTIAAVATKAIDGGAGTADELVSNTATYATNAKITGFETLGAGTAANGAFDATGFTAVHVGSTVTGATSFTHVAAGTTLSVDAAPGFDITYTLADATGTADSVVVNLSTATTAGVAFAAKNIDLSGIEAVTVHSLGTGAGVNTVTLVDTSATSLTLTGGEATTVTLAGATKLATVDASAVTKAVILTGVAVAATGATIHGSATASSTILGGAGADHITGGTAADTITTGAGLDIITGGGGADTFVLSVNANGNTYATITDAQATNVLNFGTAIAFNATAVSLADTAVFQDYLDAVCAGTAGTGQAGWFQFGGNTYVVDDLSAGTTFSNGHDIVVKLTGTHDLSTAVLAANALTLH